MHDAFSQYLMSVGAQKQAAVRRLLRKILYNKGIHVTSQASAHKRRDEIKGAAGTDIMQVSVMSIIMSSCQ